MHIVEYLEENNETVINPGTGHDGLGLTVLHYAAQNGHLNIVSFYTKLIPDPNPGIRKKDTNLWGKTPLHYAAQLGHLPVIKHICNLLTDKNTNLHRKFEIPILLFKKDHENNSSKLVYMFVT